MLKLIEKIFGSANDRYLKKVQPDVAHINEMESEMQKLSDEELKAKTGYFKQKLDNGASLDDILHEAFAVVRETGKRALNMRHYDVQLIGGLALHEGRIAEMRTGEGKTLVATLPLYLNALEGKGAHLVTVNDYLAERDAEWMGRIYRFLGLSVGTILGDLPQNQRKEAYASDITYGTNNEFGFDYLRDNMKYSLEDMVQRDLHYAIIDEVDSILIDEARTPLIISGQADTTTELYYEINDIIPYLKRDEDYLVDEEKRSATLTDGGVVKVEKRLNLTNLYDPKNIDLVHHVSKALQAHTLYKKDDKYLVKNGEVIIVDEFTGRPMDGRRWSDGLHQAVEAKEGVEVKHETETLATVTFQNFFRMYNKLAGMTGTAETEAEEFHSIYELDVKVIPTNRPIARVDHEDVVYRSYNDKFNAIVDQIEECNERGQPVLVGTTSVEKSEAISRVLGRKSIDHNVLNAKHHDQEAQVVAQAGRKGAVTIATNMAGRGTDILLGGNPEALAEQQVGMTEVPEGLSELETEKLREELQASEEFIEAVEKYRSQCQKEKEEVLDSGGLFIIGTERHESRRIDNQLRGRAGRQGDPGMSRFFLSLEDDLLRLFNADRIAKIMDMVKMEPGVPIEHSMVTKSLENAQNKVEGRNFDIRKNLLEYDDVLDMQRKTLYELRLNVLRGQDEDGEDLIEMALDLFEEVALAVIETHAPRAMRPEDWDVQGLKNGLKQVFSVDFDFSEVHGRDGIEMYVWDEIKGNFDSKFDMVRELADALNENKRKQLEAQQEDEENVYADADEEFEEVEARELFIEQIQTRYLRAIDRFWRAHLQGMEQLRDGIGMRGYAQKDPKQEYKKEGYNLFLDMMMNIKTNVVEFVSKFEVETPESLMPEPKPAVPKKIQFNREGMQETPEEEDEEIFERELPKVGRNDPCPCGSGKKYKQCCMRKEASAGV